MFTLKSNNKYKGVFGCTIVCLIACFSRTSYSLPNQKSYKFLVVDSETKKILVAVIKNTADKTVLGRTDQAGEFKLNSQNLPETIRIESTDYFPAIFSLDEKYIEECQRPVVLPLYKKGAFLGKVVESDSFLPIKNASVSLVNSKGIIFSNATTDGDGEISLSLENYEVKAGISNYLQKRPIRSTLMLRVNANGYSPYYPVTPDIYLHVDNLNTKDRRVLIRLEKEQKICVGVTDLKGRPIKGAKVLCVSQILKGLLTFPGEVQTSSTDEEGYFFYKGQQSTMRSLIFVIHPDFALTWFSTDSQQKEMINIKMKQKGELTGKVIGENDSGLSSSIIILSPKDVPGCWGLLSPYLIKRLYGRKYPWKTKSEKDGSFKIIELPFGRYEIKIWHPKFVTTKAFKSEILIEEKTFKKVEMIEGRNIKGKILSEENKPLIRTQVVFRIKRPALWKGILGDDEMKATWKQCTRPVTCDKNGCFVAEGLPYDSIKVLAMAPGYTISEKLVTCDEDSVALVLKKTRKKEKTIAQSEKGDLKINLSCMECVVDLDWTEVLLYKPNTSELIKRFYANASKGTMLCKGLPFGKYDVSINPYGYIPFLLKDVTVPGKDPLEVKLSPAPILRGKINKAHGINTIYIYDLSGYELWRGVVRKDGGFDLWGPRPGAYKIKGIENINSEYVTPVPVVLKKDKINEIKLVKTISPSINENEKIK